MKRALPILCLLLTGCGPRVSLSDHLDLRDKVKQAKASEQRAKELAEERARHNEELWEALQERDRENNELRAWLNGLWRTPKV